MSIYSDEFQKVAIEFAEAAAAFLETDGVGVTGIPLPAAVKVEKGVSRWPITLTVDRGDETVLRVKVSQAGSNYIVS